MSLYIVAIGLAVEVSALLLTLSLCRVAASADQQMTQLVAGFHARV